MAGLGGASCCHKAQCFRSAHSFMLEIIARKLNFVNIYRIKRPRQVCTQLAGAGLEVVCKNRAFFSGPITRHVATAALGSRWHAVPQNEKHGGFGIMGRFAPAYLAQCSTQGIAPPHNFFMRNASTQAFLLHSVNVYFNWMAFSLLVASKPSYFLQTYYLVKIY